MPSRSASAGRSGTDRGLDPPPGAGAPGAGVKSGSPTGRDEPISPPPPCRSSASSASSSPSTNRSQAASASGTAAATTPGSSDPPAGSISDTPPRPVDSEPCPAEIPGATSDATIPSDSASVSAGLDASPELSSVNVSTVATSGSDVSLNATSCTEAEDSGPAMLPVTPGWAESGDDGDGRPHPRRWHGGRR